MSNKTINIVKTATGYSSSHHSDYRFYIGMTDKEVKLPLDHRTPLKFVDYKGREISAFFNEDGLITNMFYYEESNPIVVEDVRVWVDSGLWLVVFGKK